MTKEERLKLQIAACKVRMGVIESTHGAKAGHPGGSLSAADMFTYLYNKEMRVDPTNPKWENRDRFVLSKGHTAPTGDFSRWRTCPPCATLTAICRATPI